MSDNVADIASASCVRLCAMAAGCEWEAHAMYKDFLYEIDGPAAVVTMNRSALKEEQPWRT